ncbi:MAG: hypothetical protein GF331_20535 [Chitinivibrionales bacterium]|nr:hypothetical protein [Chitinivibrionales bacterium]
MVRPKRIRRLAFATLATIAVTLWGCSDDTDSGTTPQAGTGGVAPKIQVEQGTATLDIGPYIETVSFHLYNGVDYDTTAKVPYAAGGASFQSIPPGDLIVVIEGLDADSGVLCRGTDTVAVIAGVTSEPTIVLEVLVPFIMYVDEPANGDTVYSDSVTMQGTIRSMHTLAFVRVGTTVVQPNTSGDWTLDIGLTEGENTFYIQARDVNNSDGRDTVSVWYRDTSGPVVSVTPQTGQVSQIDSVLVQVTASDPSGVSNVTINQAAASQTGSVWSAWVKLTAQSNTISIAAIDDAVGQNVTITSIVVFYNPQAQDTTAPVVMITSPSRDTTVYDTSGVLISGLATDAGSGIATVTVNGEQASYSASSGIWSATVKPAAQGPNMVRVVAQDNVGLQATDSVLVIYSIAPEPPSWNAQTVSKALNEGETAMLSLADSCSNPTSQTLTFRIANASPKGEISGGTYIFTAGVRSAGTWHDTLVAEAGGLADTMVVTVTVSPTYYVLSVSAADANGTVSPSVTDSSVRWGDTVTIVATPGLNYEFDQWSGDAPVGDAGNASIKVVMNTEKSLTAHFVQSAGCQVVTTAEDLNAVIQSAVSGAMGALPVELCPEEGDFTNGTAKVRINGRIRISVE